MKIRFLSLLLLVSWAFCQTSFGQTLDPLWLKQIASAQSGGGISFDESVDLIETDSEGNVYVAGFMQVNGQVDTTATNSMPGNSFTYLAKFNCNGEYQWHKQFGNNAGGGSPISLEVVDTFLNLCVGYGSGPGNPYKIDDDTTIIDSPTSGGGGLFIVYSISGNFLWEWGAGNDYLRGVFPNITFFSYDNQGGLTYDQTNSWYGFSYSTDTGFVGNIPITDTGTFLTKIDNLGNLDSLYMIYPKRMTINKIKFLKQNRILIHFGTSLPFYTDSDTFVSGGGNFLAVIDTLGNFYWANNTSNGFRVKVSEKNNIFVFGGGSPNYEVFGIPRTETGGFLAQINKETGDSDWLTESKQLGVSVGATACNQLSNGNIILGGSIVGEAIFGTDTIQSYSNTDIWIQELDSTGSHISVDLIVGRPSSSIERVYDIAADLADNIYFGGYFEGRFEYPSDTVFKRGGVSDGFFAKLGSPGCFVCPTTIAHFSSVDSFLKVNFDASASLEADSFFWDFDDGSTDTGVSPTHSFSMGGSYNACLIAKSDCDADTICQVITVADSMVGINDLNSLELSVYPNPSRDGVFTVRTEAGLDGEIVVYDLLGKLVLTQSISQEGKTILEIPTVLGTYFMELRAKTKSKTEKIQIQ
jgi:hypothetical protein